MGISRPLQHIMSLNKAYYTNILACRNVRRCVALILGCLLSVTLNAREVRVKNNNRVANDNVTAICKDQRGFMWIGTNTGLNSYDGYSFVKMAGDLDKVAINHLQYDSLRKCVWAGTQRGLFRIDERSHEIHFEGPDSTWATNVTGLTIAAGGTLSVAYENGIIAQKASQQLHKIYSTVTTPDENNFARGLADGGDGSLLFCLKQEKQFYRLRPDKYTPDTIHVPQPLLPTTNLLPYKDEIFFYNSYKGDLYVINKDGSKREMPAALAAYHSGKLFTYLKKDRLYLLHAIVGHAYLEIYNLKDSTLKVYGDLSPERLKESFINCLFSDYDGIIWVGTSKGIIRISIDESLFSRLLYNADTSVSIRGMTEDADGNIYIGSYRGLYKYSPATGALQRYQEITGRGEPIVSAAIPFALLDDGDEYIYIVQESSRFIRFNKKTQKLETAFYASSGLGNDGLSNAFCIAKDATGLLWIGTNKGLVTYDTAKHLLSRKAEPAFNTGEGIIRHLQMRADKRTFWAATNNGLFLIDREKGILKHYNRKSVPALSSNNITFAQEDSTGNLWVGTAESGIDILNNTRTAVSTITTLNGLSSNIVYGILWQNNNRIWISTGNGLSNYDVTTGTFTNYYTIDGLTNSEFNASAFFKDHTGRMYFGTLNGINTFLPENVNSCTRPFYLFPTSVSKWSDKEEIIKLLDSSQTIVLAPGDHSLVINLALTDYHDPDNNIYLYRIAGLFDTWVSLEQQHSLRLETIPPGKYTLEIKALNSKGVAAANILKYQLIVHQVFYKTWWFFLLLFLFFGGLVYLFFRVRIRTLQKMQQLRVQIASDLHDEVGSLLTRITMFADNLQSDKTTNADKNIKLEKIGTLSRHAVSSMSDVLWAIDARNDVAGYLVDRMREHAEEVLAPLNIDLSFDISSVNQKQHISSETRQQLYLIFKEIIHNIVKHSNATNVVISYLHREPHFMLKVTNNGVSPQLKASIVGKGLKNMAMRASRIGATCTHLVADGTFTVTIER
ncbi:sensor histidine kinase [Chitinophagaceae bacterium MMS25-I14]